MRKRHSRSACKGLWSVTTGVGNWMEPLGAWKYCPRLSRLLGKMTVLFDSGVRTGVDVIKALCLGAKGVLIGRPFVYGLAIGGKNGAKSALKNILAVDSPFFIPVYLLVA